MAPRLSPEQKAINKEATRLRDNAYRDRRRQFDEALAAARDRVNQSDFKSAALSADAALAQASAARTATLRAIDAEIAELQRRRKLVEAERDQEIGTAKKARDAAWAAFRSAFSAAEAEVKARYQDIASFYTAAAWKSFEEFLPGRGDSIPR